MCCKSVFKNSFYLLVIIILISSCKTKSAVIDLEQEILELHQMMIGSYDSSSQAETDSNYYNISLHMYPIWTNRLDGRYLYVEQALASMQDKPYRQRVYKLESLGDGKFASHVYKLKNDSLFIGKWRNPKSFDKYGLSLLEIREGCEVVLEKNNDEYIGSTIADNCKSTLRGASYATSVVSMSQNKITSWDQGFDKSGTQVWGATEGPYEFIKLKK